MIENIPARDAFAALRDQPQAKLCDVRTDTEWHQVGVPDLSSIGKQTAFVSWQVAPGMQHNPDFIQDLVAAGLSPEDDIYFICRSGARSHAAAQAAQDAGYGRVFNVTEGFEGRPGAYAGWAAQGLPSQGGQLS